MATALKGLNRMKGYIMVGQESMLLATNTSVEHKNFRVHCDEMDGLDNTCVTRLFALVALLVTWSYLIAAGSSDAKSESTHVL